MALIFPPFPTAKEAAAAAATPQIPAQKFVLPTFTPLSFPSFGGFGTKPLLPLFPIKKELVPLQQPQFGFLPAPAPAPTPVFAPPPVIEKKPIIATDTVIYPFEIGEESLFNHRRYEATSGDSPYVFIIFLHRCLSLKIIFCIS